MGYDRGVKCANSNGGNTEIYVFPYIKYSRSQILYTGNYITTFPYSAIYSLDSLATSFTESVEHENGGAVFNQSGSFQLNKILPEDSYVDFVDMDWRIIARDGNGYYRMIGTHTGAEIKYTKETGGSKSEFNGFKFTLEAKEEKTAGFLASLSGFDVNELSLLALQQPLQYTL